MAKGVQTELFSSGAYVEVFRLTVSSQIAKLICDWLRAYFISSIFCSIASKIGSMSV